MRWGWPHSVRPRQVWCSVVRCGELAASWDGLLGSSGGEDSSGIRPPKRERWQQREGRRVDEHGRCRRCAGIVVSPRYAPSRGRGSSLCIGVQNAAELRCNSQAWTLHPRRLRVDLQVSCTQPYRKGWPARPACHRACGLPLLLRRASRCRSSILDSLG